METNIYKNIWLLGAWLRNPSIFSQYKTLKNSEKLTIEQLKINQYFKLKDLLQFSYLHSPYYGKIFDEINFNPFIHFNKIDDIKFIPIITKKDLLDYNSEIHANFKFKKVFKSETSGTSGQILKFYKDEPWDSFNRAVRMRGYSWHGVSIWERNGYFWGYNFSASEVLKIRILDSLQNRFRLFTYDDGEINKFCRKLRQASYLTGYSSMIYEVAKKINSLNKNALYKNLKMVCGTSEKVFDHYQHEALKAFGKRIINEYGAAEAGIIAFECPYGNMHITMEGIYVEEENGEIIVTNLIARSFPIVRYKLGDYITLKPENYRCPCGLQHRVIENVIGRVGKLIYGNKNTFPSLTLYNIFKNLALKHSLELNYRVIQQKVGFLKVYIEKELNQYEKDLVNLEFRKYFHDDLIWEIISNVNIHAKKGKFVDFVSEIN